MALLLLKYENRKKRDPQGEKWVVQCIALKKKFIIIYLQEWKVKIKVRNWKVVFLQHKIFFEIFLCYSGSILAGDNKLAGEIYESAQPWLFRCSLKSSV